MRDFWCKWPTGNLPKAYSLLRHSKSHVSSCFISTIPPLFPPCLSVHTHLFCHPRFLTNRTLQNTEFLAEYKQYYYICIVFSIPNTFNPPSYSFSRLSIYIYKPT